MDSIEIISNAKINIGLLIKGKRPDGYHLLETLFYPVELSDEIRITKTGNKEVEIEMEGMEEKVALENNLIYKAWKVLQEKAGNLGGVRIQVKKQIPAGAGLGGGSSNAAFTMKGINQLFDLGIPADELARLSQPLGADVPFFIYNKPMFARGIGHDLEPYDLQLRHEIQLVTPGIHSSTVGAYKGLDIAKCDPDRSLKDALEKPVETWKDHVVNDLEMPVFQQYPQLEEEKEKLYKEGAVYAAMTGSGSALFGLF